MDKPRRLATLVAAVGLTLGGCQVAVSGQGAPSDDGLQRTDAREDQRKAVDEALGALARSKAITYRGTATDGTDPAVTVGAGGTLFGSLPMNGHVVRLAVADGRTYVLAPVEFWQGEAVADPAANAGHWVGADPVALPVQPGTALPPDAVASGLRSALRDLDPLAEAIRAYEDGVEVYDIRMPSGQFAVTVGAPYRVTRFDIALLGGGKQDGVLRPEAPTSDALAAVRADFEATLPLLVQAVDSAATVVATSTATDVECASGGTCTTTVQVENTVAGSEHVGSVKIALSALVTAGGLGEQTCTGESAAAPNTVGPVSCEVRFQVPNRTAQYQVLSMPTVTGQAISGGDVEALRQVVRAGLAG